MYLFAISAIRCTIHRTYSKEISSRCTPLGDQRNISMWVYVTFHLQWFWKGNWLHSNLVPGLFMEFALSHTIRFDLLPLDLSKGYHFFVQMNGLGRFASIGCVGAASCSFDSCSVHRAIRRSLPRSHICTKPSERCRIPTDILNHPGKASGRC